MIRIWLDRPIVDALNQARGPRETISDVIVRTAREAQS